VQRGVSGFSPSALRNARRHAGWTVNELAVVSGVSSSVLSSWERGGHQPTITRLRQVAEALGVEIADLLGPSASRRSTLTDLRIASGLTLEDVAARAGIHHTTISRAETGGAMSARTLAALAETYDATETEIERAWQRSRREVLRRLGRE
jgi:transcriptional regulator with XRE-family HTH domain